MNVLLSIKEKYSRKIFSNQKIFELRRRFTQKKVVNMIIYETSPTKKVVGKARIKEVHKFPISKLWNLTKFSCGITKKEFFKYFKGLDEGVAIELENIKEFKPAKLLKNYNLVRPPQSFQFIDK